MLPTKELSVDVQRRVDNFINERIQDGLSRKDALEVLGEYIELKTCEKITSNQLKNWLYEGRVIPTAKLLALNQTF